MTVVSAANFVQPVDHADEEIEPRFPIGAAPVRKGRLGGHADSFPAL